jgi:pyridoxine kinase
MATPPLVLTLQSQVVFGHVGNSAAVFPLQAAGLEVAAIPTVLFSNTPAYPTLRGGPMSVAQFADLLLGAKERGLMERAGYLITGFIGSADIAHVTADFIADAKAVNPTLIYVCDPVMGDDAPGLYVPATVAAIVRDRLLPLADYVTPNAFELRWLCGHAVQTLDDLKAARHALRLAPTAHLIATGCTLADTAVGEIETVVLSADSYQRYSTTRLPHGRPGTGDVFTAVLVAALANGVSLPEAVDTAQRLTVMALAHALHLNANEVVLSDHTFRRALVALGSGQGSTG